MSKQSDWLNGLLLEYAFIDPDELGEDKFGGHHNPAKATQAIATHIDRLIREARIDELKRLKKDLTIYSSVSMGVNARLGELTKPIEKE